MPPGRRSPPPGELFIGIDAGTSVVKAVAFDRTGRQVGIASLPNRYRNGEGGAVVQVPGHAWDDCAAVLRTLGELVEGLAGRTAAIGVTGQGDGTWLVGADDEPVGTAWLWLDARAAPTVRRLLDAPSERARFEATGTGLSTCQQGAQLAHMLATVPDALARAEVALHCKDWLYLKLTGVRATDPSEASFTFGDFRTRAYDDAVIDALGLSGQRRLLPEIVDGSVLAHPLSGDAAVATGLRAGTPVSLGFVDMVCTALGAGVHTGAAATACSVIGSTGVHLRSVDARDVRLSAPADGPGTGYVLLLPVPGRVTQVQSNMAATLNIDWLLGLAGALVEELGGSVPHGELVDRMDGWLAATEPGTLLYHPYISSAGERGPFMNADARASFLGLCQEHGFPHLVRAVVEGLGLAARDCYAAMGPLPAELRLTGGATRSAALRGVLAASVGVPVRVSSRQETGAVGAAMMASVAVGRHASMHDCIADWVTPLLGEPEAPDPELARALERRYPVYADARRALAPVWAALSRPATTSAERT